MVDKKEGSWFSLGEDKNFEESLKNLFEINDKDSPRTSASKVRERSKETLVNRVYSQVLEMEKSGMKWRTPEDWDESFTKLGGGSKRRKSKTILSRMAWTEFLNLIDNFLNK